VLSARLVRCGANAATILAYEAMAEPLDLEEQIDQTAADLAVLIHSSRNQLGTLLCAVNALSEALAHYRLMTLSAFAGGIPGVASGLPLGFQGGLPRCLLSEFCGAGLLLGFQRSLTSGSLGDLRSG
jgi:hypothetical protein